MTLQQVKKFQQKILTWYQRNKRDLPWRGISSNIGLDQKAYYILISEVMTQQTQIARVIPKYHAWLKKFPTIFDLSKATTRDVLTLWSGLGYNRRALYLLACARIVTKDYQGKFPQSEKELLQLPGIGKYTARALLCFAFKQQVAVVDTNVKKVLLTQLCKRSKEGEEFLNKRENSSNDRIDMTEKEIELLANKLLPEGKAYEWNQALMDYAAMELKKVKHPYVQKQARFKGSDRYYRGEIIRLLLAQQMITRKQLQDLLLNKNTLLTREKLDYILEKMQREKLITSKDTAKIQLIDV